MLAFVTGLVAAVAALLFLRRRAARAPQVPGLSDDAIREIEAHGRVEMDEPLDRAEIEAEERRFWDEEEWDESEEW